mgnify:CR=1 FL=1
MERYPVGLVLPLREKGEYFADVRVVRRYRNDEGEQMIETEIVALSNAYRGNFAIGTKITFPEDGFIGTFANP